MFKSLIIFCALFSILFALPLNVALYDGGERCFLEEVPQGTLVSFKWKPKGPGISSYNREPYNTDLSQLRISAGVYDPQGNVFLTREYAPTDKIIFTSQQGGEYKLCIKVALQSGWFGSNVKYVLEVDTQSGDEAIDYEDLAKKEHLSILEVNLNKLLAKMNDIAQEQHYQRSREEQFRDTTENTNDRVRWWSILQTVILLVCGVWQINHLKKYFKSRKLVY